MKTKNIILTAMLFLSLGMVAQIPEKINYQGVARDATGEPLTGTVLTVVFDILEGSASGSVAYSETQTRNTNQFGLFTAEIGGGTVNSGVFSSITWGSNSYYLRVTINGDVMTASQLLSVPYALYSKNGPTGAQGPAGIGINWLGTLTTVPTTANLNDAYYNSTDGKSYIYDGATWTILSQDGNVNGDNWGTDVVNTSGTNILGDGSVGNPLSVIDNDTSKTNELQTLAFNSADSNIIEITNGNGVSLSSTTPLVNQVLTWDGGNWTAQNPGSGADNWGSQVVATSGTNILGDGTAGNPLIVTEGDPSTTNEIQNLSVTGNSLNISGGTGTQIAATAPATGDYLYWNGLNWVPQSIAGNTDNQNLLNGGKIGNNQILNIQNGVGTTFSVADGDSSSINEIQTLNYVPGTQTLSISGGNSFNLMVDDADNDPNNEIELPATAGVGDVLTYTAGSWVASAPLNDGDWLLGAGFIYNNTDNIAIGTSTAPSYKLQVDGTGVTSNVALFNHTTWDARIAVESATNSNSLILFQESGTTHGSFGSYGSDNSVRLYMGSSVTPLLTGVSGDLLGIGTATPSAKLDIVSNSSSLLSLTTTAANSNVNIDLTNTGAGAVQFRQNGGSGGYTFYTQGSGINTAMTIKDNSRVGINNVLAPFSELDVNGRITMRTGAVVGYLPVSDGNGTMTWTDPSTLALGSSWLYNGIDIYNGNSGNVGVGITAPDAAKFHVLAPNNGLAALKLGNTNQPTREWYFTVNGSGNMTLFNEGNGTAKPFMYFEEFNQLIGIGTISPAAKLHVENNELSSSYATVIQNNDSLGGGLFIDVLSSSSTISPFNVSVNGFDRVTIAPNGNLGVGITNPTNTLHVVGGGLISGNVHLGSAAPPTTNAKVSVWGSGWSNAFRVSGTSDAQVFMIESAGNVGIGAINPINKLDVEGGVAIGASYAGTNLANANSLIVEGDVSIGSPTISSLYKVQITSSVDQYGLYSTITRPAGSNYGVRGNASSTAGWSLGVFGYASSTATVNYGLWGSTGGGATTNWALYASGNSFTSSAAWTPSDERLKKDVSNFEGALSKISQLTVKTYVFDNENYPTMHFAEGKQYGVMAQNLEQIFPEMVLTSNHNIPDKEGNLTEETMEIKAVNYDQLIPVLVKGMQEQQKMIEALKKEVEALKKKQ